MNFNYNVDLNGRMKSRKEKALGKGTNASRPLCAI
jgi:hypothetical protein